MEYTYTVGRNQNILESKSQDMWHIQVEKRVVFVWKLF